MWHTTQFIPPLLQSKGHIRQVAKWDTFFSTKSWALLRRLDLFRLRAKAPSWTPRLDEFFCVDLYIIFIVYPSMYPNIHLYNPLHDFHVTSVSSPRICFCFIMFIATSILSRTVLLHRGNVDKLIPWQPRPSPPSLLTPAKWNIKATTKVGPLPELLLHLAKHLCKSFLLLKLKKCKE